MLEVCQVGSTNICRIPRATCIPTATHHKLKRSIIAKDKEEAKLVRDRGHHTPEESAQLGNCFLPSSSRNRGSSVVVAASRVVFDGDRHRGRMMRQYVDTISACIIYSATPSVACNLWCPGDAGVTSWYAFVASKLRVVNPLVREGKGFPAARRSGRLHCNMPN